MSSIHQKLNFRHLNLISYINNVLTRKYSLYTPGKVFSEENIKKAISKFSSMKPFRFQTRQPYKKAAFLIPLCEIDDKVCLLYTLTPKHVRKFGGQVSCN